MSAMGQDLLAAFIALTGALLATAIALGSHNDPSTQPARIAPVAAATSALDAELAHCKAIGPDAVHDAVCGAIWERSRERFFESEQKHLSGRWPGRGRSGEVLKGTQQSPSTQNLNSLSP
jgi:conjugative transfer region protein TrbK